MKKEAKPETKAKLSRYIQTEYEKSDDGFYKCQVCDEMKFSPYHKRCLNEDCRRNNEEGLIEKTQIKLAEPPENDKSPFYLVCKVCN